MNTYTLRRKRIYFFIVLFINDVLFLTTAFIAAFFVRFGVDFIDILGKKFILYYILYSLFGIAVIIFLLIFNRLYSIENLHPGLDINIKLLLNTILGIFAITTLNFYVTRDDYLLSRAWLIYVAVFVFLFLFIGRIIVRRIVSYVFKLAGMKRNVIIIGVNEEARRVASTFSKVELDNANIAGFVDPGKGQKISEDLEGQFRDFRVLGNLENIRDHIEKNSIDTIVISTSDLKYDELLEFLEKVNDYDLEILMSPSLFEFSVSRMRMFDYGGVPLIQLDQIRENWKMRVTKFVIDYTIGLLLLIAFLLIYPVMALAIKLDSEGPVLYRQERYGENFRRIKIYKFRTMVKDAEKYTEIVQQLYDKEGGFKIKDDPRITRAGKFLRKTSLDELPQILNVFRGELSVIGPRALAIQEGDQLEEWEKKRMTVNQGITGLWQVSGRSDLNYEERMKLDLFYIHNWSVLLEIKIIFLTVLRILFRRGAY
jgi:exopolysaccharide biosynthesis polyprenyl glycosylphosphotransferase